MDVFHVRLNLFGPRICVGAEQDVNLFKRHSLCLRKEQENKDSIGKTEDAKHQKGAPALEDMLDEPKSNTFGLGAYNAIDSRRGDLRDDEVEQPLRGSRETDTICTESGWEDLRVRMSAHVRLTFVGTFRTSDTKTQGVGPQDAEYPMTYR